MASLIPREDWRYWLVPWLAAAAVVGIVVTDANRELFLWINTWSQATGDGFWAWATIFGDTLVALVCLLPFYGRRPDVLWAMVLAALFSTLWVHGLKPLFDVPRPPAVLPEALFHVIGPAHRSGSFPSGHATTVFTLAGILVLHLRNRAWWAVILPAALVVALSRSVVGVHWPLDVAAGAFGGWYAAVLGTLLARRWPSGEGAVAQTLIGGVLVISALVLLTTYDGGYPQALWLQRIVAGIALLSALPVLWRQVSGVFRHFVSKPKPE